jgi:hypothetical protein
VAIEMPELVKYKLGPQPDSYHSLFNWYERLHTFLINKGMSSFTKEEAIEACHKHTCRSNSEYYVESMMNRGLIIKADG